MPLQGERVGGIRGWKRKGVGLGSREVGDISGKIEQFNSDIESVDLIDENGRASEADLMKRKNAFLELGALMKMQ
ncbi:hypothetical protein Ancab_038981 [Ancistrocladus abbreviatus]